MVAYAGNAATSPPGQGFGAPVSVAPSGSSIVQLIAAAGHALAIWAGGSTLSATTEPVT